MNTNDTENCTQKTLVLVIGLYKSGTSLITELVEGMGVSNLEDLWDDFVEGVSNTYLTHESQAVNELNDTIIRKLFSKLYRLPPFWLYSFLCSTLLRSKTIEQTINRIMNQQTGRSLVIKDPRFCVTIPIWLAALEKRTSVKLLWVIRNRMNIVRSWLKDDWCVQKLKLYSKARAMRVCKQYEQYLLRQYLDFSVTYDSMLIDFEALKKFPDLQIEMLMKFVGFEGNARALRSKIRG